MVMPRVQETLRHYLALPVARGLARLGVGPNAVTLAGLALTLGAAYLVSQGWLLPGGAVLLLAGALDAVDGALARVTGKDSPVGALLDSVADRLAEASFLLGLLWYYLHQTPPSVSGALLVYGTLVASVLVSYVRARAEGLGVECKVGIMGRTERVVVLGIGLLVSQPTIALWVVMALSFLTAGHRFLHTLRRAGGR